jgi:integrase
MKAKITKRTVDAVTPAKRDTFIWDTELKGFGLKVTPANNRVYILQYRMSGPTRRYTIGRHGSPWTPDSARHEATRLLGLIAAGNDPAASKADDKIAPTVAQLCDLYLVEGAATKKASTLATDRRRVECHIKPLLGRKRARAVTRADIERFMRDVAAGKTAHDMKTGFRGRSIIVGGKGAASRVVGLLGGIFTFAVNRNIRSDNPVRGVKRFKDGKSERFLSPVEMTRLGEALALAEREGANPFGIAAIRLLTLTGCRKGEILSLCWDHVDFERACLRLPDSKTGAKTVPLGAPALELLASLPRIEGTPFVLPSRQEGKHFVGLQKIWARVLDHADLAGVRIHDLRHSFASTGAASGDSLVVIGALLGHRGAATTQRYAHLSESPVQAAANRIAGTIAAAMNGGDKKGGEVVELPNRTA